MSDPTIVIGSLDNTALQKSVEKMVADFNQGLSDMLSSANTKVGEIQKTLEKIGQTKFGSGTTDDGGASKRSKGNDKEAQSAKELDTEYQRLNSTLKEQQEELARLKSEYKSLESAKNAAATAKPQNQETNNAINSGRTLAEVKGEIAKKNRDIAATKQQLAKYEKDEANASKQVVQANNEKSVSYDKAAQGMQRASQGSSKVVTSETQITDSMKKGSSEAEKYAASMEKIQRASVRRTFEITMNLPKNDLELMYEKIVRLESLLSTPKTMNLLKPSEVEVVKKEIDKLRDEYIKLANMHMPTPPDRKATVGEIQKEMAGLLRERKVLEGNSTELRQNIELYAQRQEWLQRNTATAEKLNKIEQKPILKDLGRAETMSAFTVEQATEKYKALQAVREKMAEKKDIFDVSQFNRVDKAIETTRQKMENLGKATPKEQIRIAMSMPDGKFDAANSKLKELISLRDKFKDTDMVDNVTWNRLNATIDSTEKKLENFKKKASTEKIQIAMTMSDKTPEKATKKLIELVNLSKELKGTDVVDKATWNRLESSIDGVKKKVLDFKRKAATEKIQITMSVPDTFFQDARRKLAGLNKVANEYKDKGILDEATWNRLQGEIDKTGVKIKDMFANMYKDRFQSVTKMPTFTEDQIIEKLKAIEHLQSRVSKKKIFDESFIARVNAELENTKQKLNDFQGLTPKLQIQNTLKMPVSSIEEATQKIKELKSLSDKFEGKGVIDATLWKRLQDAITATEKKVEDFKHKTADTEIKVAMRLPQKTVEEATSRLEKMKEVAAKYEGDKGITSTAAWVKLQAEIENTIKKIETLKQSEKEKEIKLAIRMPDKDIVSASDKLNKLNREYERFKDDSKVTSTDTWISLQRAIDSTTKKVETYKQAALTATRGITETPVETKSARDSFLVFQTGFKARADELAKQIKDAEDALTKATQAKADEFNTKITNAKSKLNDLYQQLTRQEMEAQKSGNFSNYNAGISRTKQQIEYIDELKGKLANISTVMSGSEESQKLTRLRNEHEHVLSVINQEVSTEASVTSEKDKQIAKEKELQAIREQTVNKLASLPKTDIWSTFGQTNNQTVKTVDEVKSKLEQLKTVRDAMRQSGLFDESQMNRVNKAIENTEEKFRRMGGTVQESSQQQGKYTYQQMEAFKAYREHIHDTTAAMKELLATNKDVKYTTYSHTTGQTFSGTIYAENDARAKGLSIEEQILQVMRQKHQAEREYATTIAQRNAEAARLSTITGGDEKFLQSRIQQMERMLETGKKIQLLGGFEIKSPDAAGLSVAQQLEQYTEKRKNGLIEQNKQLDIQLEISKAIAQANGAAVQNQKNSVKPKRDDLDEYTKKLAQTLGVRTEELTKFSTNVKEAENHLKQLKEAYANLDAGGRNSAFGKQLREDIQYTTVMVDNLKREVSRPIGLKLIMDLPTKSFDEINYKIRKLQEFKGGLNITSLEDRKKIEAIEKELEKLEKYKKAASAPSSLVKISKMDEKTLDDITRKIRALQSYRTNIEFDTQKGRKEITELKQELDRLQKKQNDVMGKNESLLKSNNALARSFNYMKNRLAFYFTVGASTQFVKNLIEIRSQYEMNERALGILINSAERGSQIFQELSNMALVSPYTLIELSTAAKQLTAYDVAARDVVDTTRRLADMTAAVGIPIERLTYAIGQVKAYGYLNARDARMFSNAGIPLVKELADYYTQLEGKLVSASDVYDRIKKKAIGYNDVMQVVNKMTDEGGKFFDFQAKMADTLKVRLANLTLAWNNMLNAIGESKQGALTWVIGALKEILEKWKQIDSALKSVAWAGGVIIALRAINVLLVKCGLKWGILSKQMTAAGVAGSFVAKKMASVGASIKALVTSPLTWWSLLAFAIVDVTRAVINMDEAQKQLNKSIADGAKDNYENISKFLAQYKNVRESLYKTETTKGGNKITTTQDINNNEASKVWENVREQIELTTRNADSYIGRLLTIENVSERVRQGFNVLDDIEVVNAALKDAGDDAIKVKGDFMNIFGFTIGDGLVKNLKDYADTLKRITDEYGNLENAQIAADAGVEGIGGSLHNLDVYFETFKGDLNKTTQSITDFINIKGWSTDINKISEVYSIALNKIILENNLTRQQGTQLRIAAAQKEYDATLNALYVHLADEQSALTKARDERAKADINKRIQVYKRDIEFMRKNTAESRVYWSDFTKWMSERHRSEVQAMFKEQNSEQIKSLDFSKGEYNKWAVELAQKYAKENGMAYTEVYNQLKNYITDANQWSIRIPIIISVQEGTKEIDILKQADSDLKTATDNIERLKKRADDLEKKGAVDLGITAITPTEEDYSGAILCVNEWSHATQDATQKVSEASDVNKEYTKTLREIEQNERDAENARIRGGRLKDKKGNKKDPVLEALRLEIDLIKKAQSEYDKLTKAGSSSANALDKVYDAFGKTIESLNNSLRGFGLPELDLKDVVKGNPNDTLKYLEKLRDALVEKGLGKTERFKVVETVIEEFKIKAETYNLDMITKGLNNELGKLKDEYELAVELDANPELGDMFANMMGINIDELPRTVREYSKRATSKLNKYLVDKKQNIQIGDLTSITNKDLENYQKRVKEQKLSQEAYDLISKGVEDVRGKEKKFIQETRKEYESLIKKYGEYEAKIEEVSNTTDKERLSFVKKFGNKEDLDNAYKINTKIQATDDSSKKEELRRELAELVKKIAANDDTRIKLQVAIDEKDVQEKARVAFEEFQKSPEWITATGDLGTLSQNAIRMLINEIEEYKKHAKDLDPKYVKNMNKALKSLYKEERKVNPFKYILNMLDRAKTAMENFQPEIDKLQAKIAELQAKKDNNDKNGIVDEKTNKSLKEAKEKLSDLIKKQKEVGEIDATQWVGAINDTIGAVKAAICIFDDLAKAIGGVNNSDVDKVFTVLESAGNAAAIGAQIGGTWGAIIGGVTGAATGIISIIANLSDEKILNKIKESERAVNRLENAYKNLAKEIEKAYGQATIGANQAAIANKKLQLEELKRQLSLEQSRDSKHRDQDRIESIRGEIFDLENEIKDMMDNLANDLLGMSSVGDAAQALMDGINEALRNGETKAKEIMKDFNEDINDMIANMVKKMLVTKVIQPWFEEVWNTVQSDINKRGAESAKLYEESQRKLDRAKQVDTNNSSSLVSALKEAGYSANKIQDVYNKTEMNFVEKALEGIKDYSDITQERAEEILEQYREALEGGNYEAIEKILEENEQFSRALAVAMGRGKYNESLTQNLKQLYDKEVSGLEKEVEKYSKQLSDDTQVKVGDIKRYAQMLREGKPIVEGQLQEIADLYKELGIFGDKAADKELSALQQGIQGITEDTAGAIEAYMNGVSQQVYYQSEILTQIRDAVSGLEFDVQIGTLGQMLLQLQTNYVLMQSMESLMQGWTNPAGNGIRVELLS